jgi:hypothetical protein
MDRGMPIAAALRVRGYAFLPALEPEQTGAEIAEMLGVPVALGAGPAVHTISPRGEKEATPNTYSGLFGYGAFPFHSDLANWPRPPRFVFLRAVVGYPAVPTLLVDGEMLVRQVGELTLRRALVRPRRPVKGSMPLMRLYEEVGSVNRLRWDQTFIKPAGNAGREGIAQFQAALEKVEPISVALARRGDTLVIDNWRMLHARGSVPEAFKDRVLERAYLEEVR